MPRPRIRRLYVLLAIVVAATLAAPTALAQVDQRRLVTAATVTLASFLTDPDLTWLKQNLGRALRERGVVSDRLPVHARG